MESVHDNLNALLNLHKYLGKKILFISEKTPNRNKLYDWIPSKNIRQFFYQYIKACDMASTVMRNSKDFDVIFIFEHKPLYSLFLYIACIIKKKPVFFIIHDIQQTYRSSYAKIIGFKTLLFFEKRFDFWPIHLEKSDNDFKNCLRFSKSKIVLQIPFPNELQKVVIKTKANDKIKIGVVGMIRPDKPIMKVLKTLEEYAKENNAIEIHVGTPFWQLPEYLKGIPFQLVDTSTTAQYSAFLSSLDIVVSYYEKDSFYYRSSGVLNDVVSAGCFIIVPDYPVLKEQITNPVTVGATYSEISDIKNTLDRSIVYIQNNIIEFEKWRQFRYNETILKNISGQMAEVLTYKQ